MDENLPNWFVLKQPPSVEVEIFALKNLGLERVEMLKEFTKVERGLKYHIYKQYYRRTTDDEISGLKGHLFLRLVGANSPKIGNWLIEVEGDLFEILFKKESNPSYLLSIIHYLFGKENFITLGEFRERYPNIKLPVGMQNHPKKYWCISFEFLPFFVANRKGFLSNGWLIARSEELVTSFKKRFEDKLAAEIEQLKDKVGINETVDRAIIELEDELQDVQIRRRKGDYNVDFDIVLTGNENLSVSDKIELFPPCMRFLIFQMEKKGRLAHNLRLQLGFFLKEIGMPLEEQMEFWWRTSVDNVGISKEQFFRRSGYQIRFIYGLEGGRKDYKVPKCSTIFTSYFCFFQQLPISSQKAMLMSFYPSIEELNKKIKVLEKYQMQNNFGNACGFILANILGNVDPRRYRIVHPLQWTRAVDNKLKKEKKKKESNSDETKNKKDHHDKERS